jgi:two-component system chemotaxis sensor kinase CheA
VATGDSDINNSIFAEFIDDFFAECDEHLTMVRRALLELEPFIDQPRVNRDLLDELFRGFHSLKGLAGMVGVADVEQLAHHLEGYLRVLRQEQLRLTAEGFEALIVGTRMLEQVVAAQRTHTPPPAIESTLERLAALITTLTPIAAPAAAPQSASQTATFSPDEEAQLALARERGDQLWLVTFTPTPELAKRDINVNNIRGRLQEIGELIRAAPRVIPAGGIAFDFVVASRTDEMTFAAWHDDGLTYAPYLPLTPADSVLETSAAPPALVIAPSNVVRVDLDRLDELMQLVGALVVSRGRLADQLAQLELLLPVAEWRALQETALGLERQLRDLRTGVLRMRMVPIGDAFTRMQFVVRDLARELHKQVTLDLRGQDTEIDKFVVERMLDPLVHLVRNAVSHGLEMPDERVAAGKPPAGTLTLQASTTGDLVTIDIEDDGRGIDADLIAVRARTLGMFDGGAALDQAQLLQVLCAPGFSTREQADRVSGRGVGMDVVYKTVQELGGTLTMATAMGSGTRFTVQLPLTLAILEALLVSAGDQIFAVPLPVVREVIRVQADQISRVEYNELLRYRGGTLPLVRLARRFGLAENAADAGFAFIIGSGSSAVGVAVDRLIGKREIVVRPINDPLAQADGIAAATELGDGRVVLILDAPALIRPIAS